MAMKALAGLMPIALPLLLAACDTADDGTTQRERIGHIWKYEERQPSGGGPPIRLAYIGSTNSVATMTAPDTFAVLLLQKLRSGETEVTVKLVGAPFTCDLSDCAIAARVDGKPAGQWRGRFTDTKDGIAIPPAQKAFDAIRHGKTVTVDLVTGPKDAKQGFTFNTAGLDWQG
jgi:hypothetical protein